MEKIYTTSFSNLTIKFKKPLKELGYQTTYNDKNSFKLVFGKTEPKKPNDEIFTVFVNVIGLNKEYPPADLYLLGFNAVISVNSLNNYNLKDVEKCVNSYFAWRTKRELSHS